MKNTGRDPIMTAEVEVPEKTDDQMYLEYLGSYAKLLSYILESKAFDTGVKLMWIRPFLKDLKSMATNDGDEALFQVMALRYPHPNVKVRTNTNVKVRTNNGAN